MMANAEELRSRRGVHKSFVRFFNNTHRRVDVVWINYEGHHVKYRTLSPGNFLDVNTFVTHPWLFIDSETNDKLVVKSEEVFLPEQWLEKLNNTHNQLDHIHLERTHVYITIPLLTLRQRSLQVIRDHLLRTNDAFKLEIPINLQNELANLVNERKVRAMPSN